MILLYTQLKLAKISLCLAESVSESALKSLFWAPSLYQDLTMCHHWPVKKAIVDLPIRLKGNSKLRYGKTLSLLGPQSKDLGTALQMLLVSVRTHLQHTCY